MPTQPLTLDSTLADWATTGAASTRILEALRLDFCCQGGRSLREACAVRGLDPETVRIALVASRPAPDDPAAERDWRTAPLPELVDHIVARHHAFARSELDRLGSLVAKVARVHGAEHAELGDLATTFGRLDAALRPHLDMEERRWFPAIVAMARTGGAAAEDLGDRLAGLEREHVEAGALLERIRHLARDYAPPPDACGSYRAMLEGLAALEADTHLHVHAENHILFPRARMMAAQSPGRVGAAGAGEGRP